MMKYSLLFLCIAFAACHKVDTSTDEALVSTRAVMQHLGDEVIYPTYANMQTSAAQLAAASILLRDAPSENALQQCRTQWLATRAAWEQSEAFLFGPVSTENIDPTVDTWPIDFARVDSLLNSTATFTTTFIDGLEESLKGFHPIEYLLWGANGNKSVVAFTERERELLFALSAHLQTKAAALESAWNAANSDCYTRQLTLQSTDMAYYTDQRAAANEVLDAMIGICEELGEGKIGEPFSLQDPSLEESPFAKNSISDFRNNLKSVQRLYYGTLEGSAGKGIYTLVQQRNLQLATRVAERLQAAQQSLEAITLPFNRAISEQAPQVQQAMHAIGALKEILEEEAKPFLQPYLNDTL